jgi:8-oxo-dGTP pyrophosphatase MutT (NUDIX family)|tara:strand:- start:3055 stop:3483 length:429 start_codon:yes stop_codon:yes gene_type:complete
MLEKVKAGGGLVINKEGKLLFIFRKGIWDLPKGKMDLGETLEETAVRETSEETGVPKNKLKVLTFLTTTRHIFYKTTEKIKDCSWYLMKTKYKGKLVPQKKEGIEKCEWLTLEEFKTLSINSPSRVKYVVNFYEQLLWYEIL